MYLVTGATGNIGSEIVRNLRAVDAPVRAMVRDPAKAAALAAMGVELVRGDFADPASLDAALSGIERAFLLSPPDPRMVDLQSNFVQAAVRQGVRGIVKLSGAGASATSPELLARLHFATEEEIRATGIPYTFVQPVYFMQNVLAFAPPIRQMGQFFAPVDPALAFTMVDVRDIAAVATAALTETGHAGKSYLVTGPALLSFAEVAATLSETLGTPVRFVQVPPERVVAQLKGMGMSDWLAEGVVELYETLSTVISPDVPNVLHRPAISFAQFARDHMAAFA